ncbi:MAG: flagellar motor protein MotB [Bdellovibrionaceae bacterium]|nr:flagellar motor protein MotB [Pseudobdellovibrionaceae bacterium]
MGIRKKKHEEHENLERWLVSYADFITLLFAFFTVLYALSQTDKAKYQEAVASIRQAMMSGGGVFPLKGVPFKPFESEPDHGAHVPPSPADQGMQPSSRNEMERAEKNIQKLFEKNTGLSVAPHDIEVFATKDGFRIRLAERLLFNSGSSKIKRENASFLFEMGKRLSSLGTQIQIEGHTDDRRPASVNNWQLSLERSTNVVKFLVEAAEYPQDKISIAGYGDKRPIADNSTPDGRARNRRVEIAVITAHTDVRQLPW